MSITCEGCIKEVSEITSSFPSGAMLCDSCLKSTSMVLLAEGLNWLKFPENIPNKSEWYPVIINGQGWDFAHYVDTQEPFWHNSDQVNDTGGIICDEDLLYFLPIPLPDNPDDLGFDDFNGKTKEGA